MRSLLRFENGTLAVIAVQNKTPAFSKRTTVCGSVAFSRVLLFVGRRILIAQETDCPERYTVLLLPGEMILFRQTV